MITPRPQRSTRTKTTPAYAAVHTTARVTPLPSTTVTQKTAKHPKKSTGHLSPAVSPASPHDSFSLAMLQDLTPAQVLARFHRPQFFPNQVLAMLQYCAANRDATALVTWCGRTTFALPAPRAMDETDATTFFGKRWDLVLRSLSEWGFDVMFGCDTDPIRIRHRLVTRAVLDREVSALEQLCFEYNSKRPRISLKTAKPRTSKTTRKRKTSPNHKKTSPKTTPHIKKGPPTATPTTTTKNKATPKTTPAVAIQTQPAPHKTLHTAPFVSPAAPVPSVAWLTPEPVAAPPVAQATFANDKFPFVLANLMCATDPILAGMVHWNEEGNALLLRRIRDTMGDEKRALQRFFAHGQLRHVARQLDAYHFDKVVMEVWTKYSHPFFQRDNLTEEMLVRVTRRPTQRACRKAYQALRSKHVKVATAAAPPAVAVATTTNNNNNNTKTPSNSPAFAPSPPSSTKRQGSATLLDLIAAADWEESHGLPGLDMTEDDYRTPQKPPGFPLLPSSGGLTPLAQRIYPTFDTPGFDSISSIPTTPHE